jgi:Transglycosylase SLT domain
VKRYAALGVFLVIVLVVVAFVQYGEPAWIQRLRYPLEYKAIVTAHAQNYRLQPALLAAVIYQESKFDAQAKSSSGAIGLMQLQPATAQGIALRTGGSKTFTSRRSTSATGRGTCGTCSTSTATSGWRSPPTTPGSGTSTSGRQPGRGSSSERRGTT